MFLTKTTPIGEKGRDGRQCTGIMRSYIRTGTMAYWGYDRVGRTSKAGRFAERSNTDLDAQRGGRHWGTHTYTHTTALHSACPNLHARKVLHSTCAMSAAQNLAKGPRALPIRCRPLLASRLITASLRRGSLLCPFSSVGCALRASVPSRLRLHCSCIHPLLRLGHLSHLTHL